MKFAKVAVTALVLAAAVAAVPAGAQEFKGKSAGDIVLRARALVVIPDEGGKVKSQGLSIGAANGLVDNADYRAADFTTAVVPELDLSYFFTDNIAVEVIAGVTNHHLKVKAKGPLPAGGILHDSINLGDVWLLPPTVTAQYHFFTKERISPYLGAGVNATFFFGANKDSALSKMSLSPSIGPALQAGVDIALTGSLFLNLDVKKIWMNTDLKATLAPASNGPLGVTGPVKASVDIDPWLVGVGIGYRF
ncbi:outer membrane protein [uncultured Gammaproteobacteria bacterium]